MPLLSLPSQGSPLPLVPLLHALLYRIACRLLAEAPILAAADTPMATAARYTRRLCALISRVHIAAVEEAARRRVAALVSECLARGLARLAQVVGRWVPRSGAAGTFLGDAGAGAALRPFPVREEPAAAQSGPVDDPLLPDAVVAAAAAWLSGGSVDAAHLDEAPHSALPLPPPLASDSAGAPASPRRPLASWPLPLPLVWSPVRSMILPWRLQQPPTAYAAVTATPEHASRAGVDFVRLEGLLSPHVQPIPRFGSLAGMPRLPQLDSADSNCSSGSCSSTEQVPAAAAAASAAANGSTRGAIRLLHALQEYVVCGVTHTPLGQALCSPSAVVQHATALAALLSAQPAIPPTHKELQDPETGLARGLTGAVPT